ncbi:MAG: hypothetical protein ABI843_02425 [Dokdonella sp.]
MNAAPLQGSLRGLRTGAATAPARQPNSTPHQRLFARTTMQQLDLDVTHITAFHRRFFEAAGLEQPRSDARVDEVLCALTRSQISALISCMRREVSDE